MPGAGRLRWRVEGLGTGCPAHWVGELRGTGTPAEGEEGGDAAADGDEVDPEHRLGARAAGITVVGEEPNLGGLTCPRRHADGDLGDVVAGLQDDHGVPVFVGHGQLRDPQTAFGTREEAEVRARRAAPAGARPCAGPGQTGSPGGFADQVGEGEVGDEAGQSSARRGSQHDDPDPGTTQLGEQRGELPAVG